MGTLLFWYVTFRSIIDGMEELLIIPTALYYIESFGQSSVFLGITLAAYSIGALLFVPLIGKLNDRTQATKTIVMCGGLMKFGGNVLYSIPVSEYFPLCGRFMSGIGEGSIAVLYGVVAKCTSEKNRTKAFMFFEGLDLVGITAGPMVGSLLTFKFDILGWKINTGNSPGFILAIIWMFLTMMTFFLPKYLGCDNSMNGNQTYSSSDDEDEPNTKPTSYDKLFNSKILCIYFLVFMNTSIYRIIEFYTPLLAAKRFHFRPKHVKLIFINATLYCFALYLTVYLAAGYCQERFLMVFQVASHFPVIFLLFYFSLSWSRAASVNEGYLLLVLACFGMNSFAFPVAGSMLSKFTDPKHVSFYQGLLFAVVHLAVISSRLVGGFSFNEVSFMYTCMLIAFLWVLQALWLCMQYKTMKPVN